MKKFFAVTLAALLLLTVAGTEANEIAGTTRAQSTLSNMFVQNGAFGAPPFAADPFSCAAVTERALYWNTAAKKIMVCNGTSWDVLGLSSPVAGDYVATGKWTWGSAAEAANSVRLGDASGGIVFEGATDNAFELTLASADPAADVAVTIPATAGTLATLGDVAQTFVNDLTVGSVTTGRNIAAIATRGLELAPTLPGGYTCTAGTWTCTGAVLDKDQAAALTAYPTASIAPTAGVTYEVTITLGAVTVAGGATYTLGGTPGDTALTAATTYTHHITAATTGNLIITPVSAATRFTITAISVKALTDATGDVTVGGNLTVRSPAYFKGPLLVNDGSATAPSVSSISTPTTGIYFPSGTVIVGVAGSAEYMFSSAELRLGNNGIGFHDTAPTSTPNLTVLRDASDTLALRRTTNAQKYNIYSTYTSATNFERAELDWQGLATWFRIGTAYGSVGGTPRGMGFGGGTLITDVAPPYTLVQGSSAYAAAATNTTGGDTKIVGGLGRRAYTAVTTANCAGDTFTIVVDGASTTLTDGTSFTHGGTDAAQATNLAAAIDALAGVTALATTNNVYVTKDANVASVEPLISSDATCATATNGIDGRVVAEKVADTRGLTRAWVVPKPFTLADNTATPILNVAVPADTFCSAQIKYSATTKSATVIHGQNGTVALSCAETPGASAYACNAVHTEGGKIVSDSGGGGTYAESVTTTDAATSVLNLAFDSSLNTATTLVYVVLSNSGCVLSIP